MNQLFLYKKDFQHSLFRYLMIAFILICFVCESNTVLFAQTKTTRKKPDQLTEKLVNQSDYIAIGKVARLNSEWTSDRKRIETHATIDIEEYLKGNRPQKTMIITYLGGEVGEVGEYYSRTASFKQDEEVVVFVKKNNKGGFRIINGLNGKLTIQKDEVTGKRMVSLEKSLDAVKSQIKKMAKK